MKIDRSNYEIWFIDFLDGNLDSHQADHLTLFLNENPDLKEELNDLNLATIEPFRNNHPGKELMKKSPSDITLNQVEYLSVAYLENDLLQEQKSELFNIIANDTEKKRAFDLVQKTRVVPPAASFKYKKRLIRRTVKEKIIRLSVIGLSTAAAVTLLITTFLTTRNSLSSDIKNLAAVNIMGTKSQMEVPENRSEILIEKTTGVLDGQKIAKIPGADTRDQKVTILYAESTENIPADSMTRRTLNTETGIHRINFNTQIDLKNEISTLNLIASGTTIIIQEEDNGRNNFGKYLAKTFREKILKEKTPPDAPIKGYEIAEAGVTGLNKIFGWEMAFDKKTDDTGQLKSVYFSSRMLKFTAPVKKSEPLP